jgi:integration host factor subunit beta
MTKANLIEEVSRLLQLPPKDSEAVVNAIFDKITEALVNGDKVELRGFGSFRIRHRKPRTGRNPRSGTRVDVPSKRVPTFTVGKQLRQMVNS